MTNPMGLMAAQMGISAIGTVGGWAQSRFEAKMAQQAQKFQQAMAALSASRALNAVTINEARMRDAGMIQERMVQQTGMAEQAQARVGAAAAGVAGGSVDMVMTDLTAAASSASYAIRKQADQQMRELGESRKDIRIQAIQNRISDVIPSPSVGSLLLGLGMNTLKILDSHRPEGQRMTDIGPRTVRT